ncbi:MAG: TolC family protein [Deltaproteobacteria bacterium]|nr:TolC family protein [Deltaproteobacteria bacterium]
MHRNARLVPVGLMASVLAAALASCYRAAPIDEAAVLREIRAESRRVAGGGPADPAAPVLLTEEAAVAAAVANAPRVVAARGEVAVARAGVREARRLDNPELRASNEHPIEGAGRADQLQLAVRWDPPNPWVFTAATAVAEAEVTIAEARLATEIARAAREARSAHNRAAHAAARSAVADEQIRLATRRVDLLGEGARHGATDPLDLAAAGIGLAETRAAAARAGARGADALVELAALTGIAAIAVTPLEPAACSAPPPGDPSAEDAAATSHPLVREARAAYARSEAVLREQHARQVPWLRWVQIGWEHRFERGASPGDPAADPARDGLVLGAALELPFLDWNLGGVARGKAERDRDGNRLRASLAQVVASARAARDRWRGARASFERLVADAAPAAQRAVETAGKAAAAGRIPEAAALDAMARALRIRVALLDAALECREAEIEARRTAGEP